MYLRCFQMSIGKFAFLVKCIRPTYWYGKKRADWSMYLHRFRATLSKYVLHSFGLHIDMGSKEILEVVAVKKVLVGTNLENQVLSN